MNNKIDSIIHRWVVDIYEMHETGTADVEMLLSLIKEEKELNILEVCCGSGRILLPLVQAGHTVTGLDMDALMLAKLFEKAAAGAGNDSTLFEKAKNSDSFAIRRADVLSADWGNGYDLVVLGANILINIVTTEMEYKKAQELFLQKAAAALRSGGHLFLDCTCFAQPERVFGKPGERVIFEGTDGTGTSGKMLLTNGKYDTQSQISQSERVYELITAGGEQIKKVSSVIKHIPTAQQIEGWLTDAGFKVEQRYGSYSFELVTDTTHRAIYYASLKTGGSKDTGGGKDESININL